MYKYVGQGYNTWPRGTTSSGDFPKSIESSLANPNQLKNTVAFQERIYSFFFCFADYPKNHTQISKLPNGATE